MTIKQSIAILLMVTFLMSLMADAVAAAAKEDPVIIKSGGIVEKNGKKLFRAIVKDLAPGHSVAGKGKNRLGKMITEQKVKTTKGWNYFFFEYLGLGSIWDIIVYYPKGVFYHQVFNFVPKK